MVIGLQYDGTRDNLWAKRYVAGDGWGAASIIENGGGTVSFPQPALDSYGNAIVLWCQQSDTRYDVWANRYSINTGWGTAMLLEPDNINTSSDPQVAMAPSGNAIVMWSNYSEIEDRWWINTIQFDSVDGWGISSKLSVNEVSYVLNPRLVFDESEEGIVIWTENQNDIWSSAIR
jgi:hypothetical protein